MIFTNPGMSKKLKESIEINQIKKWYEEFKKFMNYTCLPCFIVKYKNDYDKSFNNHASVTIPVTRTEKPTLYLKNSLLMVYMEASKPILFHEFTHIMDDYVVLPHLSAEEKAKYLKPYTEYHATKIEMMILNGFSNVNDNIILKIDNIIHDKLNSFTLIDFIKNETIHFKQTINSYLSAENPSGNFFICVLNTIYYLSKYDFFYKYCNDKSIILELFDVDFIRQTLGEDIIELCNLVKMQETVDMDFCYLCDDFLNRIGDFLSFKYCS